MQEMEKIGKFIQKVSSVSNEFRFLENVSKMINEINSKFISNEIILPFIGEFSSGKSSLLNTILEGNVLPVDIPPTTFTINEIRFSQEKDKIELFCNGKKEKEFEGLINLRELGDLSSITLIRVYTVKKEIPKMLVIVDPPGLSSDISKHEEVLLKYIPKADAIFLCLDVNQGVVTKVMERFLNIINPLNKKIYVVYLKSDTKSASDLEKLKNYAQVNFPFKPEKIIFTSAKTKNIKEFLDLINTISVQAEKILCENISKELSNICNLALGTIKVQIESAEFDDKQIEKNIKEITLQREKLKHDIEIQLRKTKERISEAEEKSVNLFRSKMKNNLSGLVEAAFGKEQEEFEKFFDEILIDAGNAAIKIYQEGVQKEIKEFGENIKSLAKVVDVDTTLVKDFIELAVSGIFLFISMVAIPGSHFVIELITAIAARLGTKWRSIDKIIKPLENVIKAVIELATKNLVKEAIEEAIEQAVSYFKEELGRESEKLTDKIEKELWEKFNQFSQPLIESLEGLKEERKKKLEEFTAYIKRLKNAKNEIEAVIDGLV